MPGIKQIKQTRPVRKAKISSPPILQDEWLNERIDTYLTGTMYPSKEGIFHPSTLSNKCDRAVWLIYHGHMPPTPLDPTLQRIFQNGNYLEKRVENWFAKMGILMGREISVRWDSPAISGRMDFLIRHEELGIIPIELKSINTAGFGKLRKPKDEHQLQLQMYLNMGDYAVGTVLYENKNDQKLKSFIVERDSNQWELLLDRCYNIMNMTEPPANCTGEFWCNCKKVNSDAKQGKSI